MPFSIVGNALWQHLQGVLAEHTKTVIAIAGPPGAGKSTLAEALILRTNAAGVSAVWLPMDGFHLADAELKRLGYLARKGARDTFDSAGYVSTLERVVAGSAPVVYAPAFDRTIEQPIAGSIPIHSDTHLVVTEGNYLLDQEDDWVNVPSIVTEAWYCDIDDERRHNRLVRRHVEYGKSHIDAETWVHLVDEANARNVKAARSRADLIITANPEGVWDL